MYNLCNCTWWSCPEVSGLEAASLLLDCLNSYFYRLQSLEQEGAAAADTLLESCPSIKPQVGLEDWSVVYSQRQALENGVRTSLA